MRPVTRGTHLGGPRSPHQRNPRYALQRPPQGRLEVRFWAAERNADVQEHANSGTTWMGGVIAVCALVALIMFGSSGNNNTASNLPSAEPGMTTGAAPATPSKDGR